MMSSSNRRSVSAAQCILLLLVFENALASDSESRRVKMCGKKLSDVTIFLCHSFGGLNQPTQRRSERALNLFEHRVRPREASIVDECCRNTCSLQQLLQYCARPSTKEEESKIMDRFLQVVHFPSKGVAAQRDGSKGKDEGELEDDINAPSQLNTNAAHSSDFIFA